MVVYLYNLQRMWENKTKQEEFIWTSYHAQFMTNLSYAMSWLWAFRDLIVPNVAGDWNLMGHSGDLSQWLLELFCHLSDFAQALLRS